MIDEEKSEVYVTPTSSFFADNGLFGSWPSQDDIEALISWGVDVIVNLASVNEKKIKPYDVPPDTNVQVINFPIQDRSVPDDKLAFSILVVKIYEDMKKGKKVYIHCKGGHGRSGLLVAAILAYLNKITPQEALALTSKYHSNRKVMKSRWRDLGSPQTPTQKKFVVNLFTDRDTNMFRHHEIYMKFLLMQTYLGRLCGPDGHKLTRKREKLMKSSNIH